MTGKPWLDIVVIVATFAIGFFVAGFAIDNLVYKPICEAAATKQGLSLAEYRFAYLPFSKQDQSGSRCDLRSKDGRLREIVLNPPAPAAVLMALRIVFAFACVSLWVIPYGRLLHLRRR